MSTGPRTPEGKAAISAFQRQRWAAWRQQQKVKAAQNMIALLEAVLGPLGELRAKSAQ